MNAALVTDTLGREIDVAKRTTAKPAANRLPLSAEAEQRSAGCRLGANMGNSLSLFQTRSTGCLLAVS